MAWREGRLIVLGNPVGAGACEDVLVNVSERAVGDGSGAWLGGDRLVKGGV